MKRERVLELWKEFCERCFDKKREVRLTNYNVDELYIDESLYLNEFLFDFVNFIEDKIFDEHRILNEEESKKFIEEMEKKEKEYDGDIFISGKV